MSVSMQRKDFIMFETCFLLLLGTIFFAVGILGICKNKITVQTLPILIFPVVGFGIIFFTIMFTWDISILDFIQDQLDSVLSTTLLLFAMVVGLVMLLVSIYDKKQKQERCIYPVEAYCSDLGTTSSSATLTEPGDQSQQIYSPTWKYTYGGKEYTYKSNYGGNFAPPELGGTYTIYIDPSEPEYAWIPEYSSHSTFCFIGVIAIVISSIGLILVLF